MLLRCLRTCLATSFAYLWFLAPLSAQVKVDERVPSDMKAILAATVDAQELYKNKLVKMLVDQAIESSGEELPIGHKDLASITAFVAAPKGMDFEALQKMNFYVNVTFTNTDASAAMKKLLMSEGGRQVTIKGKDLIAPPEGDSANFMVEMQAKNMVIGSEDYITSSSNQFASQGLAKAYSRLPNAAVRVAVDLDGARDLMDQLSTLAKANADFFTKPYVSFIDEVSSLAITSDINKDSLLKISLTGHNAEDAKKIKQKADALVGLLKGFAENAPLSGPEAALLPMIKEIEAIQMDNTVAVEAKKPEGMEAIVEGMMQQAQKAAKLSQDFNTFKMVGIAMHNYHDVHGEFPFAKHVAGEDSGKGLSWTVYMLPFLEESALYENFDLEGDYNSPQNSKLGRIRIASLQLKTGGQIMWVRPTKVPLKMSAIHDGTSNTVAFVQAKKTDMLPWSKAKSIKAEEVIKQFKNLKDGETMIFGMYDGSVIRFTNETEVSEIEAMLEPADGKYPKR